MLLKLFILTTTKKTKNTLQLLSKKKIVDSEFVKICQSFQLSVFSTMTYLIMNVPNMGLKNFNLSLTIEGLISLYVGTFFKSFSRR